MTIFVVQLSIQLALSGFAEFILHLTRLGPEMLQIAQDSGRLTVSYSRFEVDDTKGKAFHVVNLCVINPDGLTLMFVLVHPR